MLPIVDTVNSRSSSSSSAPADFTSLSENPIVRFLSLELVVTSESDNNNISSAPLSPLSIFYDYLNEFILFLYCSYIVLNIILKTRTLNFLQLAVIASLRCFSGYGILLPLILGEIPRRTFQSCDMYLMILGISIIFTGWWGRELPRGSDSIDNNIDSTTINSNNNSKSNLLIKRLFSYFLNILSPHLISFSLHLGYSIIRGNILGHTFSTTILTVPESITAPFLTTMIALNGHWIFERSMDTSVKSNLEFQNEVNFAYFGSILYMVLLNYFNTQSNVARSVLVLWHFQSSYMEYRWFDWKSIRKAVKKFKSQINEKKEAEISDKISTAGVKSGNKSGTSSGTRARSRTPQSSKMNMMNTKKKQ